MNSRIEALYREARVPHTAIDPSNNMPHETSCFSAEKFAELIVQECCEILLKPEVFMSESVPLSEYNQGWVNGRLLGIDHIRDRFGIKE
jgi:hypothetical protein